MTEKLKLFKVKVKDVQVPSSFGMLVTDDVTYNIVATTISAAETIAYQAVVDQLNTADEDKWTAECFEKEMQKLREGNHLDSIIVAEVIISPGILRGMAES